MAKGPNAFRTISEAAEDVGVPQHVLRFWESKFVFITPMKRAGRRRFYRPQDVVVLKAVRRRLHDDGLTIRGVERLFRTHGLDGLLGLAVPLGEKTQDAGKGSAIDTDRLDALLASLERARTRLDAVLSA